MTSFDVPPDCAEDKEEEKPTPTDTSYLDEIESFRALAGEKDAELLKGFLEKITPGAENDVDPIVLSPDADKSHRAEVHNFFKKSFKLLVTDTVEEAEGSLKCIRVRLSSEARGKGKRGKKRKDVGNSRDDKPFDSRGSDNWPEHLGKFLRFHLYKENKDTQEALGVIGKMLGIQQRSFGFSGTKDKRAVTTQRVTIFKQHAKRLAALNNRLFGIKVGDFCYAKEGLVLGQLSGNRFTITLRGVIADSVETINAAADGLRKNGFINYYGLQRFGSGSVPTHLIGAALLRGEWKSTVDLILDPREGERADTKKVRERYKETGDIDSALRQLPRYLVAERAVLQCLKKCPGNYLQALKAIPRTLRMMYVHSYQSFLWNHAASMRVQKYGIDRVVLGDLVMCKEGYAEKASAEDTVETEDDCNDEENLSTAPEISEASVPEEKAQFVKAVSSDDLLTGGYTFEDVVLPLPGSRILYPANDIADVYHRMAEKDGIKLTDSVHNAKEFSITSMTGSYRRVFQRPVDFVWELLTYADDTVPLAETDLDTISKSSSSDVAKVESCADGKYDSKDEGCDPAKLSLVADCLSANGSGEGLSHKPVVKSDAQLPKVALKLAFTLPASSYATMAIRELLKTSTSVAYQKTINQ